MWQYRDFNLSQAWSNKAPLDDCYTRMQIGQCIRDGNLTRSPGLLEHTCEHTHRHKIKKWKNRPVWVVFDGKRMCFSVLFFFPLGLVESGSERSSGFCARCICEEAGPRPVSLEGEPPGRTGQHCAAAGANRQPVRACTHTQHRLDSTQGLIQSSSQLQPVLGVSGALYTLSFSLKSPNP